ncbi:MAG: hypothetical protein LBF28_00585 [Rickettsiales bacterium]|jgi:hypothetical protein|nr:hypothetical protein [Rickettsiales bacterium]
MNKIEFIRKFMANIRYYLPYDKQSKLELFEKDYFIGITSILNANPDYIESDNSQVPSFTVYSKSNDVPMHMRCGYLFYRIEPDEIFLSGYNVTHEANPGFAAKVYKEAEKRYNEKYWPHRQSGR